MTSMYEHPPIRTLHEHNTEMRQRYGSAPRGAGVACDKCGCQLYYFSPHVVHATIPPQMQVYCKGCKFMGYIVV